MKSPIIAAVLLVLAVPAFAAELTATPAQWKDIHTLYGANSGCLNYHTDNRDPAYKIPERENQRYKKACDLSVRLQEKLGKQGFCITSLHRPVGRTGKLWTQEEWEKTGGKGPPPKGSRVCDPVHDPAP